MEITENTKKEIVKSHVYGMSDADIADIYGLDIKDVRLPLCEK